MTSLNSTFSTSRDSFLKKISKLVAESFVVIGLALPAAVVVVGGGGLAAAIFRHTNTRVFLSVQVALAAHSYDS